MRVPRATYRLQLSGAFRFADAQALVPYLDALGVGAVYASPVFGASAGSTHGYDVTDYGVLSPEIGGEDAFAALSAVLRARGMDLVMDVVPNHMGIADESNAWWQDVLENGPGSPYAAYFDIDWNPPKAELAGRILLPVLGDAYGRALDRREISLVYEDGDFRIRYFDRRFPVAPRSRVLVLEPVVAMLRAEGAQEDDARIELESIVTGLGHLPERTATEPEKVRERRREKEVARRRLATLVAARPSVRRALDEAIGQINGRPGHPESLDRLERILAAQAYRLSFWRTAAEEINYRRFFDVSDLAAVRVEIPEVFDAAHALPLRLVEEGKVAGLRIDHPDGLFDPVSYFESLARRATPPGGGTTWTVVEKILVGDETLSPDWRVAGTTGYEFLNLVNGLFVDPAGARRIRGLWSRLTGHAVDFADLVYACKKLIVEVSMAGELHVLARRLDRISEQHRGSQDFTLGSLQRALAEVIACFPVYRTYVRPGAAEVRGPDREHVNVAIGEAVRRNPATSASIFDFIAQVLLLEHPPGTTEAQNAERGDFVLRFQQFTGPVTAKGIEDTAFYRWCPLASLNEVGGEPDRPGVSVARFHRANLERRGSWPHSMLCTSTHDTKRSEDVRARLDVLSEVPVLWGEAVRSWRRANRNARVRAEGEELPDASAEYLIYQSLLGIWPLDPREEDGLPTRLSAYMVKALREAKVRTSWIRPNDAYEHAVAGFIERLFAKRGASGFWDAFLAFFERIAAAGATNALAQVVLKSAAPGVPDFYQGQELWDFSLVDPDNRRPVDFEERRRMLAALPSVAAPGREDVARGLLERWRDGAIKMWVTACVLRMRREHERVFRDGDYLPLPAEGAARDHVCAFARRTEGATIVVAVPRLGFRLAPERGFPLGPAAWGDTAVPLPASAPTRWRDVFTGRSLEAVGGAGARSLPAASLFSVLPVAALEPAEPPLGPR